MKLSSRRPVPGVSGNHESWVSVLYKHNTVLVQTHIVACVYPVSWGRLLHPACLLQGLAITGNLVNSLLYLLIGGASDDAF